MRLGRVLEILEFNLPRLKLDSAQNGNQFAIKATENLREATQKLAEVNSIHNAAADLLAVLPIVGTNGQVLVPNNHFSDLTSKVQILVQHGQLLKSVLSQALSSNEPGTVYFRLPEHFELKQLTKDVDKINIALDQIFAGQSDPFSILVVGFDTGSRWLVLLIKPIGYLIKFSSLMKAAISLATKEVEVKKQKEVEVKKQKEELRKMAIENDVRDEFAKVQKKLLQALSRTMAKELITKMGKDPNDPTLNEEIGRVANAINTIKTIFTDGGGIEYPKVTFEAAKDHQPEMKMTEDTSSRLINQIKELIEYKGDDSGKDESADPDE